jgi:hypothetical protein
VGGGVVTRYAEGTKVPVTKTRGEMQALLEQHGCSAFGWEKKPEGDSLFWALRGMQFRIEIKRPTAEQVQRIVTERYRRPQFRDPAEDAETEYRRRWRANLMLLKTKLEFIADEDDGLFTELLPYAVLRSGQTIGESASAGELPMLTAWAS